MSTLKGQKRESIAPDATKTLSLKALFKENSFKIKMILRWSRAAQPVVTSVCKHSYFSFSNECLLISLQSESKHFTSFTKNPPLISWEWVPLHYNLELRKHSTAMMFTLNNFHFRFLFHRDFLSRELHCRKFMKIEKSKENFEVLQCF